VAVGAYRHAHSRIFKSYSVGFSTPGTRVWVSGAYLDGKIGVLGGSLLGKWGEMSKENILFGKPMPHEIYVNWEEAETKRRYEATVQLSPGLPERARELPGYTFVRTHEKRPGGIYLIIGFAPKGAVTVWLSNAPSAAFRKGRVLDVVGKAEGRLTDKVAPFYPPPQSQG